MKRLVHAVQITLRTMLATLREIFDEAAYDRFLQHTHMTSSPAAYAAFCHEHEHQQARHPRCC